MPKSVFVERLDEVQISLATLLKPLGFRRKGRTFNRSPEEGIVQVINLQSGQFPIGETKPLPPALAHLQLDLYGRFTVNLGVHIKDVWEYESSRPYPSHIQEYHCQIRTRLGNPQEKKEYWWLLDQPAATIIADVSKILFEHGLEFLRRFETAERIIRDWVIMNDGPESLSSRARVDVALMLVKRGEKSRAAQLLSEQIQLSSENKGHIEYVRTLGHELGLGDLLA